LLPLWRWVAAALALGIALGAGLALMRHSGSSPQSAVSKLPGRPAATWAAGKQRAPAFRLKSPSGSPVSLGGFRGRPVIVTFIDPVCTSLCPLEAQQLSAALDSLPAAQRPQILAVSVNPWAQTRADFRKDAIKWRLPAEWHWAKGNYAQLARVWKNYKIGVLDRKKTVDGITVHNVAHTEASYLVDSSGYERALFLYPFQGEDVAAVLKRLL
jgi:cytochrome oxidase Cu insertion factor (SCO1/SenC/PrrC family)